MSKDKEWVKIPAKSGIWKAETPGDTLEGKYIDRISKPFKGRPNWKYCLESDHPVNVDGKVSFFGTDGLNSAMEDIPKGYEIKIVYRKTRPTADPKKQGFKVFDVYVNMSKTDPLYKKLYPEETENEKPAPEMKAKDDPEAISTIENYIEILTSQYKEPTCEAIIKMASTDPDLKPKDLTRVKVQLVELHKQGKIKSEKAGKT